MSEEGRLRARRVLGDRPHGADRRYLTSLGIEAYTPTGVIGYPSRATEAKGKLALEHLGRSAATLVKLVTTH